MQFRYQQTEPCLTSKRNNVKSAVKPPCLQRSLRIVPSRILGLGVYEASCVVGQNVHHIRQSDTVPSLEDSRDGAGEASIGDVEPEDQEADRNATDGFFDGKAYRLVPVEGGENTILINGTPTRINTSTTVQAATLLSLPILYCQVRWRSPLPSIPPVPPVSPQPIGEMYCGSCTACLSNATACGIYALSPPKSPLPGLRSHKARCASRLRTLPGVLSL